MPRDFRVLYLTCAGNSANAYFLLRCNGIPMNAFVNTFGSDLVANDCRVFNWVKTLR